LVEPTNGKIVLQRQTAHADASCAWTWWKSHYFQLFRQRVEVEHHYESLQSSRPHWLSRSA